MGRHSSDAVRKLGVNERFDKIPDPEDANCIGNVTGIGARLSTTPSTRTATCHCHGLKFVGLNLCCPKPEALSYLSKGSGLQQVASASVVFQPELV
jgi:hypothetical protein